MINDTLTKALMLAGALSIAGGMATVRAEEESLETEVRSEEQSEQKEQHVNLRLYPQELEAIYKSEDAYIVLGSSECILLADLDQKEEKEQYSQELLRCCREVTDKSRMVLFADFQQVVQELLSETSSLSEEELAIVDTMKENIFPCGFVMEANETTEGQDVVRQAERVERLVYFTRQAINESAELVVDDAEKSKTESLQEEVEAE